jgi:tRNA(Ile)-lysidine synthase
LPLEVEIGARALAWDRRWVLHPPEGDAGGVPPGLTLRALGADLAQVEGWRDLGLPRDSLAVTPALFRGDTLVAAPAAGMAAGWTARFSAPFAAVLGEY